MPSQSRTAEIVLRDRAGGVCSWCHLGERTRGPALERRSTPQQARSSETLEMILDAAERVVREEGHQALTVARVARVAGFAVGTMYQYVTTKEALLLRVEERNWARLATFFVSKASE